MRYRNNVHLNGVTLGQDRGRCPFIERGSVVIGWNGEVSPCLAADARIRHLPQRPDAGRYAAASLATFRSRVCFRSGKRRSTWPSASVCRNSTFPPVPGAAAVNWSETNEEDCFANTFPTCGGCLWAQGVIQCP